MLLGPERGLGPVLHSESIEHAAEVRLHGLLADPETPRHLFVGQTATNECQHIAFSGGELVQGSTLGAFVQQFFGRAGRNGSVAAGGRADAVDQLVGG